MSDTMHIRFESNMPVSTVEVLSPDHQTLEWLAMRGGSEQEIQVSSERSYIRLHLPSGQTVTMAGRDDLNYIVTTDDLERSTGARRRNRISEPRSAPMKTVSDVRTYQAQRSAVRAEDPARLNDMYSTAPARPETVSGLRVSWTPEVTPRRSEQLDELSFSPAMSEKPYQLRVDIERVSLIASLPGALESTYVRADDVGDAGMVITIRVAAASDFANAVGNYLARSDYYAAAPLAEWASRAEDNLRAKMRDPFAAAVGAYLLLRMKRYGSMGIWVKNLADWFQDMSDGCVIWALQVLQQHGDVDQARRYLLEAATRGWPVYMEGTRLLSENLRRLGDEGRVALRQLEHSGATVVADSPFTARVEGRSERNDRPISFDVGYESMS